MSTEGTENPTTTTATATAEPQKSAGAVRRRPATGASGATAATTTTPTGDVEKTDAPKADAPKADAAKTETSPGETPADEPPADVEAEDDDLFAAFGARSVAGGGIDRTKIRRKLLIHGESGAGKSHLLATCDARPLIISLEPQGVDTLAAANPRALIVDCVKLSKEDGAMQAKIKAKGQPVTPLAILRHMLGELVSNAPAWHKKGVTRVGFDSLHIIQQMFAAEIVSETNKSRKADGKESLDQLAKDGWGVLGTKMQNFCDTLRALDFDVLVVAISKQKETGPKYAGLQGAFSDQVNGYFNAVGYIYKQQIPGKTLDEVERLVCWDADSEKLVVKSHGGLKGITSPDAAEWFTAMSTDAEMVLKNARLPKELRRRPVAGT
jgi:hypothetical protein